MSSGIASLHRILKDETRRRAILLLQEKESLSYVELMNALSITNTGKINYHLKVLGELVMKNEDGHYALSEKGRLAARLLLEFPSNGLTATAGLPTGVSMVAALTMFCAFPLGLFAFATATFAGLGPMITLTPPPNPAVTQLMSALLAALAVASFCCAFFVLRGSSSKFLWYALNGVWVALLAYSLTLHYQFWTTYYNVFAQAYSGVVVIMVLAAPIAYSVCCIAYFLTKKPRRYFHTNQPSHP
jgi:hypothetical protein